MHARKLWGAGPLAIAALAAVAPSPADATVVRAVSLEEKATHAPLVIHAKVRNVWTIWDGDEGSAVRTMIDVEVLETLKGKVRRGDRVLLSRSGGRMGDFIHEVPGASRYAVGEEAVLFLEPLPRVKPTIPEHGYIEVGIGIGKYDVVVGPAEARTVVFRPTVAEAREVPGKPMEVTEAKGLGPLPLSDFLAEVRRAVDKQARR